MEPTHETSLWLRAVTVAAAVGLALVAVSWIVAPQDSLRARGELEAIAVGGAVCSIGGMLAWRTGPRAARILASTGPLLAIAAFLQVGTRPYGQ